MVYSRYTLRPADNESAARLSSTHGVKTVSPLDMALGIDSLPFKISPKLMLDISYWAVKLDSYQEAEEFFRRNHGLEISDDTIRKVVNYVGGLVFNYDCQGADECISRYESCALPSSRRKEGTLYIMTDGAALNTRLRGDDGSTWRENKLGLAFSTDNIYYWNGRNGERCHRILEKEYVSYIGPAADFKKHLFALAIRAGYGSYMNTVILSDGATWIRNVKEEFFPDAQQILDLFHLKENAYGFAKHIFGGIQEKYVPWAEDVCNRLECGEWRSVLQTLLPYRDVSFGTECLNLYTYIYNNRKNIDYPEYKSRGFFVGSGAIESGNKVVLQKRLKLPGMRWNVETAQCVLSLRAKLESKQWDSVVANVLNQALGTKNTTKN